MQHLPVSIILLYFFIEKKRNLLTSVNKYNTMDKHFCLIVLKEILTNVNEI